MLTLPRARPSFMVYFLPVWLVGWGFGEVMVGRMLVRGMPGEISLFILAWWLLWTAGGLTALAIFLWNVAGRERIRVGWGALTLEQIVGSLGRRRNFDLNHVRRFRTVPQTWSWFVRPYFSPFGFGREGSIAFDYGTSTISFGAGLDEALARLVVSKLTERLEARGLDLD